MSLGAKSGSPISWGSPAWGGRGLTVVGYILGVQEVPEVPWGMRFCLVMPGLGLEPSPKQCRAKGRAASVGSPCSLGFGVSSCTMANKPLLLCALLGYGEAPQGLRGRASPSQRAAAQHCILGGPGDPPGTWHLGGLLGEAGGPGPWGSPEDKRLLIAMATNKPRAVTSRRRLGDGPHIT